MAQAYPSTLQAGAGTRKAPARRSTGRLEIPRDRDDAVVSLDGREVKLTNLNKVFWPDSGITKGDLLQYYLDVAAFLLPHIRDRAMVMKRYPNGAYGEFFFQKRAPSNHPDWIPICTIKHPSANLVDFPVINDRPSLLWVVNLGCIDLNQWYATCADVDKPDYLHFDLDPTPEADFAQVRASALLVRDFLESHKIPSYPKTSGSRGIHVYIPLQCGPSQKEVWTVAKRTSQTLAAAYPDLITSEYRVAERPKRRVLMDYNQNAWGRTLASVYSARPKPGATVSAPLTWEEIERGAEVADFTIENMPERLAEVGDLFKPLLTKRTRIPLTRFP